MPELRKVLVPAEGIPTVIDTDERYSEMVAALAQGHGDIAIDTERASGYRYSERAYLVQIHRDGSGSFIIDPLPFPDMSSISTVLADATWIFHDVGADLPACRELGLDPSTVFDTELAARLLGMERTSLGTLLENLLNIEVRKDHSADDWSKRPLPNAWIRYATLDVDFLIPLKNRLSELLEAAGKLSYAEEEFRNELTQVPHPNRLHDWTRLHGLSGVRTSSGKKIARELWRTRDQIAQQLDIAPGRVLDDHSLTRAAATHPVSKQQLLSIAGFTKRYSKKFLPEWISAIEVGAASKETLPKRRQRIPPSNKWKKHPVAQARLHAARTAIKEFAEQEQMQPDVLLPSTALKTLCWDEGGTDPATIERSLAQLGVRSWQLDLIVPVVSTAFSAAEDAVLEAELTANEHVERSTATGSEA